MGNDTNAFGLRRTDGGPEVRGRRGPYRAAEKLSVPALFLIRTGASIKPCMAAEVTQALVMTA